MTKQSLKAFNTYLSNSNSPEWGTECVVGVFQLSRAIEREYQKDFTYLLRKSINSLVLAMASKDIDEDEWCSIDFLRRFNDYEKEGLEIEIDYALSHLYFPAMSTMPTLKTDLIFKETSDELGLLQPLIPGIDAIGSSYFIKISWETHRPDEPYVFILPAQMLVQDALQGVERELDYYLIN